MRIALDKLTLKFSLTLTELPTRFVTICLNLPGSPITISGTLSETNTASYSSQNRIKSKPEEL